MLAFKNLLIIKCICFTTIVVAQIDTDKRNKNFKIKFEAKATDIKKPEDLAPKNFNGFKTAYSEEQKKLKKQLDEEAIKNKGILNEAKQKEEELNKKFKQLNGQFLFPRVDQDLGSVVSNSNTINVICRDFQYPDGDRVTILVNDKPYVLNITLQANFQKFSIPIDVGVNKIAFKALNQGTSGPNTAGFKVYNEEGALLSNGEWNLATGAKATLLVVKNK